MGIGGLGTEKLGKLELRTTCRGGGMADAVDLKSIVRKDVRVRLPPSAPIITLLFSHLPSLSSGNDLRNVPSPAATLQICVEEFTSEPNCRPNSFDRPPVLPQDERRCLCLELTDLIAQSQRLGYLKKPGKLESTSDRWTQLSGVSARQTPNHRGR